MNYRPITPEERAALQRFAEAENRRGAPWRERLSNVYWYNARLWEGGEPGDGAALHRLRNDLGPTWLYDVCDIKPAQPRGRRG